MKSLLVGFTFVSGLVAAGDIVGRKSQCTRDNMFSLASLSDCQSFMATTVAHTVVTATITSTVTRFNNNNKFTTAVSSSAKSTSLVSDKSGLFTVTPTNVPDHIRTTACDQDCNNEQEVLSSFSSACSCASIKPTTISTATATVTRVEILPTTVSDFRLRAQFPNGTYSYVAEDNNESSWSSRTYLTFVQDMEKAALFAFTPDSRLRLESEGKLSDVGSIYMDLTALYFVPSTKESRFLSRSFHVTEMHESGNVTGYPFIVSPLSLSSSDYPLPPQKETNVITACSSGVCLGTSKWKAANFNESSEISNYGSYQIIDLQAIPMF